MQAHRTHSAPPRIEDLGLNNDFFYNFNVVESPIEDESGEHTEVMQYHYDQVRCRFRIVDGEKIADPQDIQECLDREGYDHQVKLE